VNFSKISHHVDKMKTRSSVVVATPDHVHFHPLSAISAENLYQAKTARPHVLGSAPIGPTSLQ